jgi:signal transduction histidine kinase
MNFYIYSSLLNAFISGLLGLIVFLKNRKETANRLFFYLSMAVVFWSLSYWQWLSSNNYFSALFWAKLLSIGSFFIPIFYFHWIVSFFGLNKKNKKIIIFLYFLMFLCISLFFTNLFIEKLSPEFIFPFWPTPGPLYTFYLIFIYFGLVVYSWIILWRQYKKTLGPKRSGIKYIFLGSLIGFGGGATNFFLWYNVPIAPYGNILVAVYPIMLTIATLKYQLFDIKLVTAEMLVFSIWIFGFIRFFFFETFTDGLISGIFLLLLIIIGIILINSVKKEISQREQIEQIADNLKRANTKLKKLNQEKSDFLSFATHQLRTPLTGIKGYAGMVLQGTYGKISGQLKKSTKLLLASSERLLLLIEDFLDISRIELGKMKFIWKKADLTKLTKSVMQELKSKVNGKKVKLIFKTPAEKIPPVIIDEGKIRQAITNLIDNAIKYTPKGKITVSLSADKKNISLTIIDTGIGIKKEDLPNLFKKYSRGSTGQQIKGTGLGLYVAKMMAEAHHGKITAESRGEGKGSKMILVLPIKQTFGAKREIHSN